VEQSIGTTVVYGEVNIFMMSQYECEVSDKGIGPFFFFWRTYGDWWHFFWLWRKTLLPICSRFSGQRVSWLFDRKKKKPFSAPPVHRIWLAT